MEEGPSMDEGEGSGNDKASWSSTPEDCVSSVLGVFVYRPAVL